MSAASRATSVPEQPHGDADIGLFEGRRIVDPVAGDRHHLAAALQRLNDAQLLLRRGAGKDHLGLFQFPVEMASAHGAHLLHR